MPSNRAGVTGRYQARCGQGRCALTGGKATSRLEGDIFALLDYVIGGGRRDVSAVLEGKTVQLDMVFGLPGGCQLVVEYDGAYWHRREEDRDFRKSREIMWHYAAKCMVVRVREYPLEPTGDGYFTSADVQVPARVDAATCARLVLLHLIHVMPSDFLDGRTGNRVIGFLSFASRPLERSSVLCGTCQEVADTYRLLVEDSSPAVR